MSYLTLAFTRKYKELQGMHEVLNARERERETGKDLSLSLSPPSSLSEMDRKGEHFKVRCLEKWQADICFSAWLVVER